MNKEMNLTLGSLFDGSGGFPLGGLLSGITTLWASEIEPFPIRVTTKRLPQVQHLGDISKVSGADIAPVDIITFGSPCTDMSVAGKRAGLDGRQSVLFYQAIRIIKEMRCATNGNYPRYIVWENVPGAFSSNKGEDFRAVLEEICKVTDESISVPQSGKWANAGEIMADGFSLAWRVFDAQYWGVPQRRKRIYLVADFAGGSAGKILFESEGLSGYSAEGFRSWQRTACHAEGGTGETGTICLNDQGGNRMDVSEDVSGTLRAQDHGHPPLVSQPNCMNGWDTQQSRVFTPEGVAPTLAGADGGGGRNPAGLLFAAGVVSKGDGDCFLTPETHTSLTGGGGQAGQGYPCVLTTGFCGSASAEAMTCTLRAESKHPPLVFENHRQDTRYTGPLEQAPTVLSAYGTGGNNQPFVVEPALAAMDYKDPPIVNDVSDMPEYIVRRMTPTECARLQGFPDWWCSDLGTAEPTEEEIKWWAEVFETHRKIMGTSSKPKTEKQIIKWLKDPHSDSAEYKMWGNGVALPNVVYVLMGIVYYTQNECDGEDEICHGFIEFKGIGH